MQEKYSDNKQSLSKKGLALYINPMLLQFYFQYILNVPYMIDFHPKELQEILYRMLFLFLDY